MRKASSSFFEGIAAEELEAIFESLERRRYPAGTIVIAEGETSREIYIAQSGAADVFVADRRGEEHLVGHVGVGATLGEMSLFTGQPAVGTVRAVNDLEVLVLSETDFERLSESFPQVVRNLGAILSERLALTDRLAIREAPGRLIVLEDAGAPPLLAYALACSVAWHTRESTLLLVVDDDPPDAVKAVADVDGDKVEVSRMRPAVEKKPCARLVAVPARGSFAPDALAQTTEDLCSRYEHILLLVKDAAPELGAFRTVRLAGVVGSGARDGHRPPAYTIRGWETPSGKVGPVDGVLPVPPLEAADETALAKGRLPLSTPAGSALGWAARDVTGLKVGVALGAGSVRGFAHWGALRAMRRLGLPIDYLAGTSVGGVSAATYAAGYSIDEGIDIFMKAAKSMFRPTVPVRSLLSSRSLGKVVRRYSGDRRIEDLDTPLAVVAADLLTRHEVVFRRGLLWKALMATVAIPGVFPVQRIGPYTLVDGGIVNPVPTSTLVDMGAGVAIGIKLVGRPTHGDFEAEVLEETTAPSASALMAIMRSIEIMQTNVAPPATDATSILVTPELKDLPSVKLRKFSVGLRYVEAGDDAVEAALPRIAAALPWLRS